MKMLHKKGGFIFIACMAMGTAEATRPSEPTPIPGTTPAAIPVQQTAVMPNATKKRMPGTAPVATPVKQTRAQQLKTTVSKFIADIAHGAQQYSVALKQQAVLKKQDVTAWSIAAAKNIQEGTTTLATKVAFDYCPYVARGIFDGIVGSAFWSLKTTKNVATKVAFDYCPYVARGIFDGIVGSSLWSLKTMKNIVIEMALAASPYVGSLLGSAAAVGLIPLLTIAFRLVWAKLPWNVQMGFLLLVALYTLSHLIDYKAILGSPAVALIAIGLVVATIGLNVWFIPTVILLVIGAAAVIIRAVNDRDKIVDEIKTFLGFAVPSTTTPPPPMPPWQQPPPMSPMPPWWWQPPPMNSAASYSSSSAASRRPPTPMIIDQVD